MAPSTVENHLRTRLSGLLGFNANDLPADKKLLDAGLDSFGFVELISDIESTFDVRFSESELISRNLESISLISEIVERKLSEKR